MSAKRNISDELLSAALTDDKDFWIQINAMIDLGQEMLMRETVNIVEVRLILLSLDLLWTLCYKWLRSRYVNVDRDEIKAYQFKIHNLYYDLISKMKSTENISPLPEFSTPTTYDPEVASILADLGIPNALIQTDEETKKQIEMSKQEMKRSEIRLKAERSLKETNPLPKFSSPSTYDPKVASILADLGIPNALIPRPT